MGEEAAALEGTLAASEQDRADKDDQIRTLKEEIGHQSHMITKLGKEKRSHADGRQKTEEDIQCAEDKCNHLARVKGKLEQALDEAEDSLEREKKAKGDVEKAKRKVEGDLKLTQEAVSDLERVKAELNQSVARKEKEYQALSAKIEDEGSLGNKYQKQIKELQSRLEEIDEELQIERGNRAKAEKSRAILKKDIEDIITRLDEAGSNTSTQVELNKKQSASLPITLFIRNRLKYALCAKEVETILKQRLIKIDGKTRTDPKFPPGFMDVIQVGRPERT